MQPYVEVYLDIETTGLSPWYGEITVVGIHIVNEFDTRFIQLVAILRTLKKSQDEVANILKMCKERVVGIENWLKTAPLELIEGIIDDYHLRQVIEKKLLKRFEEQEFQGEEAEQFLEPVDLVRAAWLTADDILRYYRIDYSSRKELSKHLDTVKKTAEVWIRLFQVLPFSIASPPFFLLPTQVDFSYKMYSSPLRALVLFSKI